MMNRLMIFAGAAWLLHFSAAYGEQPFAEDGHTLFLCHFDQTLNADIGAFAQPIGGTKTVFSKGLFGSGVDFPTGADPLVYTFRELKKEVLDGEVPMQGRVFTDFDKSPNFKCAEGTLEFYFKPDWSSNPEERPHFLINAYDGMSGGQEGFQLLCMGERLYLYTGFALWMNYESTVPVNLEKDTWHHIAFQWTNKPKDHQYDVFIDAKNVLSIHSKVERKSMSGNETMSFVKFQIGGSTYLPLDYNSDGSIDELRISDVLRYIKKGGKVIEAENFEQTVF